jgi:lysophospholipase L1-like esterase
MTCCPPSSIWWGNWGMAATRPENDYVHRIMARLRETVPTATYDVTGLGGWEISTDFYHPYAYAPDVLDREGALGADTDLVIFRLGENVQDETNFELALVSVINYVKEKAPNARIVVTGQFWTRPAREIACRNAAIRTGSTYVRICQYDLPEYKETIGGLVYGDDGYQHAITDYMVAQHPSDAGMEAIANAILDAILPAS